MKTLEGDPTEVLQDQDQVLGPALARVRTSLGRMAALSLKRGPERQHRIAEELATRPGDEKAPYLSDDVDEKLRALERLHEAGVLTDEEFEATTGRLRERDEGEDS